MFNFISNTEKAALTPNNYTQVFVRHQSLFGLKFL